jgi:hypothetical protein
MRLSQGSLGMQLSVDSRQAPVCVATFAIAQAGKVFQAAKAPANRLQGGLLQIFEGRK